MGSMKIKTYKINVRKKYYVIDFYNQENVLFFYDYRGMNIVVIILPTQQRRERMDASIHYNIYYLAFI